MQYQQWNINILYPWCEMENEDIFSFFWMHKMCCDWMSTCTETLTAALWSVEAVLLSMSRISTEPPSPAVGPLVIICP